MSVLINENGKVFVNDNTINKTLSPIQIGKFEISNAAKQFIETEMNADNVNQLFKFIPKNMHEFCLNKKLIQTKASIFKSQTQETLQARSGASQTPHINAGDELHFFFDGGYIIYFNINDRHFSVIVQAGEWMFIPSNIEHWIKGTEDHYLVIVSYHCEPFEEFHSKVRYTLTKSNAFL